MKEWVNLLLQSRGALLRVQNGGEGGLFVSALEALLGCASGDTVHHRSLLLSTPDHEHWKSLNPLVLQILNAVTVGGSAVPYLPEEIVRTLPARINIDPRKWRKMASVRLQHVVLALLHAIDTLHRSQQDECILQLVHELASRLPTLGLMDEFMVDRPVALRPWPECNSDQLFRLWNQLAWLLQSTPGKTKEAHTWASRVWSILLMLRFFPVREDTNTAAMPWFSKPLPLLSARDFRSAVPPFPDLIDGRLSSIRDSELNPFISLNTLLEYFSLAKHAGAAVILPVIPSHSLPPWTRPPTFQRERDALVKDLDKKQKELKGAAHDKRQRILSQVDSLKGQLSRHRRVEFQSVALAEIASKLFRALDFQVRLIRAPTLDMTLLGAQPGEDLLFQSIRMGVESLIQYYYDLIADDKRPGTHGLCHTNWFVCLVEFGVLMIA